MPAPDDLTSTVMMSLLGNAPSQEEVSDLRAQKQGALTSLQGAVASSQRPENYSPFQEMVANYLHTMRPGWNQYGLGQAVAAPYFSETANAEQKRKDTINLNMAQLKDTEGDLRDATALQRAGIMAGARMGSSALAGGKNGKNNWMQVPTKDGSNDIWLVNKYGDPADPTSRVIIPGSASKEFLTLVEQGTKIASERGEDNPQQWGYNYAAEALSKRPMPTVAGAAVTAPTPRSSMPPITPGGVEPNAPGSASPPFTLDPDTLPPDVRQDFERMLNRAEAQPNNIELQRNTTRAMQQMVQKYATSQPATSPGIAQAAPETPLAQPVARPAAPVVEAPTALKPPRDKAAEIAAGGEEGKLLTTDLHTLNQSSSNAAVVRTQLGMLKELNDNPYMPEGAQADRIQYVRSTLKSLGVPVTDATSSAQLVEALGTNFALHQRTQNGVNMLPGAMSNYEDELLRSMVPTLKNTKEGRAALIDYMDELSASNMRIAAAANDFAKTRKGMLTPEWYPRQQHVMKMEMARMKLRFNDIASRFNIQP